MTTLSLPIVPHVARRAGGSIVVSSPIWMVSVIMANILRPGKGWTGTNGKVTATPLNVLRWKSNQWRTSSKCTYTALAVQNTLNSFVTYLTPQSRSQWLKQRKSAFLSREVHWFFKLAFPIVAFRGWCDHQIIRSNKINKSGDGCTRTDNSLHCMTSQEAIKATVVQTTCLLWLIIIHLIASQASKIFTVWWLNKIFGLFSLVVGFQIEPLREKRNSETFFNGPYLHCRIRAVSTFRGWFLISNFICL